jgi:membrane-associated phospholipid phosphatase
MALRAYVLLGCFCALLSPSPATAQTLFKDTVKEFQRLPSEDTIRWLAIGAAIATLGRPADRGITRNLFTAPALEKVFDPGETLGGARVQLAGALGTYAMGRATGSSAVTAIGTDLLQAQLLSQALTAGIKVSARRTRPDGTSFSFPSGHASVTFASATVLQRHLGWKAGIPAYGVATYVAMSRIQEKRHFFTDVAFGAAIGIVAGRTVTIGRGDRQFAVAPMATPGGAGISFTWLSRR